MASFSEYLKKTQKLKEKLSNEKPARMHIVLGNESCDLDSMISALALAYLHSKESPALALMNINTDEFDLRTENNYILKSVNLTPSLLIFRDQIDLQELQKTCALSLSLVDHHVLKKNDMFLKACVKEIFDHRPIDLSSKWDEERVKIRIEEVGSCTTLIADEILKKAPDMLDELLTQLLYGVIVFDTIAFSSEAGKAKDLDVKITDELIKRFALQSNAKQIYQELWTAHNDVSKLSPKQLLYKDLKITEGIPLCGLPMLVLNYLKLGTEHLQGFTKELKTPVAILIGLETSPNGGVKRDIAIYDSKHNPELAQKIISELKANRELDLNEIIMELSNITYFTQNNVKLSRKFIAPIIKSTVLNVNAQNSHKM